MTEPAPLTISCELRFVGGGRRKHRAEEGPAKPAAPAAPGRIPRISRLMALAIYLDEQLRSGAISSFAEVADLGHVSRPRVTQIMNLLLLAPAIQEEILFLGATVSGKDGITERHLRAIAAEPRWAAQGKEWRALRAGRGAV